MGKLVLLFYHCYCRRLFLFFFFLCLFLLFDHLIAIDHRITVHVVQQQDGKKRNDRRHLDPRRRNSSQSQRQWESHPATAVYLL